MAKALWIKRGQGLVVAGPHTEELIAGIPNGSLVYTNAPHCPRNPDFHRLMMAILAKVIEHTWPQYSTINELMDVLKLKSGMVDWIEIKPGMSKVRFKSVSFASMGENEFHAVCDKWLEIIARDLIPGVDPQDLLREAKAA